MLWHGFTERDFFFFCFISIWIRYLSSRPWPCLIPLLCSSSQMHSDPEHWIAERHTQKEGICTVDEALWHLTGLFIEFLNIHSPTWQHKSSYALKEADIALLSQIIQHFLSNKSIKEEIDRWRSILSGADMIRLKWFIFPRRCVHKNLILVKEKLHMPKRGPFEWKD